MNRLSMNLPIGLEFPIIKLKVNQLPFSCQPCFRLLIHFFISELSTNIALTICPSMAVSSIFHHPVNSMSDEQYVKQKKYEHKLTEFYYKATKN